jgi:hypothetical protein
MSAADGITFSSRCSAFHPAAHAGTAATGTATPLGLSEFSMFWLFQKLAIDCSPAAPCVRARDLRRALRVALAGDHLRDVVRRVRPGCGGGVHARLPDASERRELVEDVALVVREARLRARRHRAPGVVGAELGELLQRGPGIEARGERRRVLQRLRAEVEPDW